MLKLEITEHGDMPAHLLMYYEVVSSAVLDLQIRLQEFEFLFTTSRDTVDVLNQTAPRFFHLVQYTLWDDLLIRLSRLTERASTKTGANLTLYSLVSAIPDPTFKLEVEEGCDEAAASAAKARAQRNKRIAHTDENVALALHGAVGVGRGTSPLQGISTTELRQAFAQCQQVLNAVSLRYRDIDIAADSVEVTGGAAALVEALRTNS